MDYKFGALPSPPDYRDYMYRAIFQQRNCQQVQPPVRDGPCAIRDSLGPVALQQQQSRTIRRVGKRSAGSHKPAISLQAMQGAGWHTKPRRHISAYGYGGAEELRSVHRGHHAVF